MKQFPTWGGKGHDSDALKEARSRRIKTTRIKIQLGLQEGKGEKDLKDPWAPPEEPLNDE